MTRTHTIIIGALLALLAPGAAEARGIAPGTKARLTRDDGRPVRDRDLVTLQNGTRIPAQAYQRLLEGWATRLRERRRVDARGQVLPLLDVRSVDATRRSAEAARRRASARGRVQRPTTGAMALTRLALPGRTPRVPLTATKSDLYGRPWGETWGSRDWVALRLQAQETLTSATQASSYMAAFDATATVLGRDVPVAAGNLYAQSGADRGFAQAWLDLGGTTTWVQPAVDAPQLDLRISRRWAPPRVVLGEFRFVAVFVPIEVEVGLQGRAGIDAQVTTTNRLRDPLARGALRTLSVVAVPSFEGGERREGAWTDLSLYGTATTLSSLREVAGELGIDGLLETIDAVPGVTVPWGQSLAGASLDVRVKLVDVTFAMWAGDRLDYADVTPRGGRWDLNGSVMSALVVRALADPSVTASAFVSYPSGVSVDFVWDVPPVEITIDWSRVSATEELWGWDGALFETALPLNILSWQTPVQVTGAVN